MNHSIYNIALFNMNYELYITLQYNNVHVRIIIHKYIITYR